MAPTHSRGIEAIVAKKPGAPESHSDELLVEEMSLQDLRKSRGLTQTTLARRLHKGQELVSRVEQRQDLLLSTLRSYLGSLGGELELICRFADRVPVRIRIGAGEELPPRREGATGAGQVMPPSMAQHQSEIAALCRRYGVRRLAAFGSALREDFNAQSSDIDLVVEFRNDVDSSAAHQYFDFKAALEQLLGCPVDLVELDAMPDSRLKRIIKRTQVPVYAEAA